MAAGIEIRDGGLSSMSQLIDPVDRAIARTLHEAGPFLVGKVKDAIRTKMNSRTGSLGRSAGHIRPDDRTLEVGIVKPGEGNALEYAKIQHEGGTVKAKKAHFRIQNMSGKPQVGPFLRIPVGENLTETGVDRGLKGFYLRTKKGNFIGVRANGDRLDLSRSVNRDIINVLKKEVTIPPHDYLVGPIEENLELIERFLAKNVDEELGRLN